MTATALFLISLDGKPCGIVEGNPALGGLEWFHHNCRAYSMDHACKHEGYSVLQVEGGELDCKEVTPLLEAMAERAGLTMSFAFVPFSQSRNAEAHADGKPWLSANWKVTLKRSMGGRPVLESDYATGTGHIPAGKRKLPPNLLPREAARYRAALINHEIETGREAKQNGEYGAIYSGKPIPTPALGDVLHSLIRDCDVLDAGGFESWASDLGYDADSRKAESIYRLCLENALKLQAALGNNKLAEMRLASRFN